MQRGGDDDLNLPLPRPPSRRSGTPASPPPRPESRCSALAPPPRPASQCSVQRSEVSTRPSTAASIRSSLRPKTPRTPPGGLSRDLDRLLAAQLFAKVPEGQSCEEEIENGSTSQPSQAEPPEPTKLYEQADSESTPPPAPRGSRPHGQNTVVRKLKSFIGSSLPMEMVAEQWEQERPYLCITKDNHKARQLKATQTYASDLHTLDEAVNAPMVAPPHRPRPRPGQIRIYTVQHADERPQHSTRQPRARTAQATRQANRSAIRRKLALALATSAIQYPLGGERQAPKGSALSSRRASSHGTAATIESKPRGQDERMQSGDDDQPTRTSTRSSSGDPQLASEGDKVIGKAAGERQPDVGTTRRDSDDEVVGGGTDVHTVPGRRDVRISSTESQSTIKSAQPREKRAAPDRHSLNSIAARLRLPLFMLQSAWSLFELHAVWAGPAGDGQEAVSMKDLCDSGIAKKDAVDLLIEAGFITCDNFADIVCKLAGVEVATQLPDGLLYSCFHMADANENSKLDFVEFAEWYSNYSFREDLLVSEEQKELRNLARRHDKPISEVEKYKAAFDGFDADSNGFIDFNEFALLLRFVLKIPSHLDLPESRVKQFWHETDYDRSGLITFEEFLVFYMKYYPSEGERCPFEEFYRGIRNSTSSRRGSAQEKRSSSFATQGSI